MNTETLTLNLSTEAKQEFLEVINEIIKETKPKYRPELIGVIRTCADS